MDGFQPFHAFSIDQTFQQAATSPEGLTYSEVLRRQKQFGKNALEEGHISLWTIFFRQFHSIPIYILFVASIVSISIGEWIDFSVVMGIIFLNGLIGFWQEVKAEVSIAALKKMTESK